MMDASDFVKNYIRMCKSVGDCEQCPCGETNFCTAPPNLRSLDVTEQMASEPECDVVFSLINYASMGIRRGSGAASCHDMLSAIKACRDAGKGVFTMKVFGGGNLTGNYQKALDYVFSKEEIQSVMIGFGHKSEIDDIVSYLDGTMPADYNPDTSQKKMRIRNCRCGLGAILWWVGCRRP